MDVLGIDNVMIIVGDLAEAERFYVGLLGLTIKFSVPQAGIVGFAIGAEEPGLIARVGGVMLGPPTLGPRVWLEVLDARAAADEVLAWGGEPLAPPFEVHTGWAVEVADPWGNVIGLTDYLRAPGKGRRPTGSGTSAKSA